MVDKEQLGSENWQSGELKTKTHNWPAEEIQHMNMKFATVRKAGESSQTRFLALSARDSIGETKPECGLR